MNISLKALMSHEEYKANVSGLNIFFGAIIGVVMADVKLVSAFTYSLLLLLVASFVVTLLYISASKYRARYAIFSILTLLFAWYKVYQGDPLLSGLDIEWLRQRLLPTFSVWLFMILTMEFLPRGSPSDKQTD